jgi:circadian clock protein KaiC
MLQQRTFGVRTLRELYVRKFRGGPHLLGRHGFEITRDGLVIYPRLEAMPREEAVNAPERKERQAFGVAGLDTALRGGLPAGSTTILFGPPGGGKTLLGMSFLAHGAQRGERGHYFAFYDAPQRVLAQTAGVGLDREPLVARGDLELSVRPPTENMLDKLGFQLMSIIRSGRVRRLFLDGYEALRRAALRRARLAHFLAALVNECRTHGVTLVYTSETVSAYGPEVRFPLQGMSMAAENILFVRSAELHGSLRRFICVMKLRNSDYDPTLRELRISDRGLEVGEALEDAQQLLTGLARWPSIRRRPRVGGPKRRSP